MPDTSALTKSASEVATAAGVNRPGVIGKRARVYDAGDPRHGGLPAWTPASAPRHLLTRRELAALGLRPGRQPVCGQLVWDGPDGITRWAWLYDIGQARLTRRPMKRRRATANRDGRPLTANR